MNPRFSPGPKRRRGEEFPTRAARAADGQPRGVLSMTRWKLMVLPVAAALALPLTADAWGKNGCRFCFGGGGSHGGNGGIANGEGSVVVGGGHAGILKGDGGYVGGGGMGGWKEKGGFGGGLF